VSPKAAPPASLPRSLSRLRLRLTAWYVGTFFAILTLLGIGMFATITRRFDNDLDASLRDATRELVDAVRRRDAKPVAAPTVAAADVLENLRIPDRTLFLVDTLGRTLTSAQPETWMVPVARSAWTDGKADATHKAGEGRILRVHAQAFTTAHGEPLIAIAAADEIELEDRYAALIAAFGTAAFVALVLVAAGGWLLARQSTEPVERAFGHMRRFMADAAHELRTPLTVVRSRAEVALQRPRESGDYVNALRGIEREAERLGSIVEDLLMLARADSGERPIEHARVFLDDVTLDAAEAARAMAERKLVRVEVGDFEEAAVTGDAALLRQLVMIVLDNAIKFTEANGVVRVGVRQQSGQATLAVEDTGVGIEPDVLPHVFERFYRGDPSRTRESGGGAGGAAARDGRPSTGAGLGLSIAQWIATEHGGTISIDSQPGQGTRVLVQFPLAVSLVESAVVSS
jgi:signal transduction histidine kinase